MRSLIFITALVIFNLMAGETNAQRGAIKGKVITRDGNQCLEWV